MVTELLLPKPRVVMPKLPSYVKLDMAFGVGEGATLFDKSRYRSHGTIAGPDWVAGLHGYALDFVAANGDYLSVPVTQTQLDFTTQDFSIVVRIAPDIVAANWYLLKRGLYNVDGWELQHGGDNKARLFFNQSGSVQTCVGNTGGYGVSQYYTLGISRAGAAAKIYVNGVDVTESCPTLYNPTTANRALLIGAGDTVGTQCFDGKMEFLRIFGGIALSTSEHLAYHNALA